MLRCMPVHICVFLLPISDAALLYSLIPAFPCEKKNLLWIFRSKCSKTYFLSCHFSNTISKLVRPNPFLWQYVNSRIIRCLSGLPIGWSVNEAKLSRKWPRNVKYALPNVHRTIHQNPKIKTWSSDFHHIYIILSLHVSRLLLRILLKLVMIRSVALPQNSWIIYLVQAYIRCGRKSVMLDQSLHVLACDMHHSSQNKVWLIHNTFIMDRENAVGICSQTLNALHGSIGLYLVE